MQQITINNRSAHWLVFDFLSSVLRMFAIIQIGMVHHEIVDHKKVIPCNDIIPPYTLSLIATILFVIYPGALLIDYLKWGVYEKYTRTDHLRGFVHFLHWSSTIQLTFLECKGSSSGQSSYLALYGRPLKASCSATQYFPSAPCLSILAGVLMQCFLLSLALLAALDYSRSTGNEPHTEEADDATQSLLPQTEADEEAGGGVGQHPNTLFQQHAAIAAAAPQQAAGDAATAVLPPAAGA